MAFLFEKLDVYQRGGKFVSKVLALCQDLPKGNSFLADQLRRSSTSIILNIAEGNGRFSKKDRKQFFVIARGSCFECVPILQLFMAHCLIGQTEYTELINELEIIGKMLSAYIRNTFDNSN